MLLDAEAQWLGAVLLVAFTASVLGLAWQRWLRPARAPGAGMVAAVHARPVWTARGLVVRAAILRILAVATVGFGFIYLSWRWTSSLNPDAWPFALALVLAETYSYIAAVLFGLTVWREKHRGAPPPPPTGATVDVFITCYDEPVEIVRPTVRAAIAIRYPHVTYVLDDGNSEQMRAMAESEGAGYIVRSIDWRGHPRHAKAGNLNNALLATTGEFILMLDADQVPTPTILDQMLGYFQDDRVAVVQSDQPSSNIPPGDPFGTDASLFYGPIMQGKDGWNAAFFCGSNAVMRRESLMQLGVTRYVIELEHRVRLALATADRALQKAQRQTSSGNVAVHAAVDQLRQIVDTAKRRVDGRDPIQDITWEFQRSAQAVASAVVASDLAEIQAELASIPGMDLSDLQTGLNDVLDDRRTLDQLASRDTSPLAAIEAVRRLLLAVDVDRGDEAQPIMPLSTISVTEDMATAMRLHALGWRSIYHHEALAAGLAPDDLRSVLQQRLRWAQGTLQVFFRENPLFVHGLSPGQRAMYLGTMWSYVSGLVTAVYLVSPVLYLFFGWLPIKSFSMDFYVRIVPYLVANQLLLVAFGWGLNTWRGQQNSVAMWPLWLKALVTAIQNVYFGKSLGFVVTPKTRLGGGALISRLALVRAQVISIIVLTVAAFWGLLAMTFGLIHDVVPALTNLAWIVYDLLMLSAVIDAVTFVPVGNADNPDTVAAADVETAAAAHGRVLSSSR